MTSTFAIVQDLFVGPSGRAKLSYVATLMLVIPMVAPALGATMLALDDWRGIYRLLAGVGGLLLIIFWLYFAESVPLKNRQPLRVASVFRAYRQVSRSPTCMTYIIINAASFAALFAYVSGSSIFFIDGMGLTKDQYSLVFAITSFGIMASAFLNGKLSLWGVAPAYPLMIGIILAICSAGALLMIVINEWYSVPCLVAVLFIESASFGLVAPNALHAAMQPLPELAGSVSALAGCVQVLAGSAASTLVVSINVGPHGVSMAATMLISSLIAGFCLVYIARAAPRRQHTTRLQPQHRESDSETFAHQNALMTTMT